MRNGTMCLFLLAFHGARTMGEKTWFPRFHGSTVLLGDRGTVDRGLRGSIPLIPPPVVKITRRRAMRKPLRGCKMFHGNVSRKGGA
jgi:hypothetical protein